MYSYTHIGRISWSKYSDVFLTGYNCSRDVIYGVPSRMHYLLLHMVVEILCRIWLVSVAKLVANMTLALEGAVATLISSGMLT